MKIVYRLITISVLLCYTVFSRAIEFEENKIAYETIAHQSSVLVTQRSYSGDIVIPDVVIHNGKSYTVKGIKNGAFTNCKGLNSIIIPEGVTSIGDKAFSGCKRLLVVSLPSSIESIGRNAFADCPNLTSIDNLGKITALKNSTFFNCGKLSAVTLPESLESIGDKVFYNCGAITNINIPDKVTSIGSLAFNGCSALTSLTIGRNVSSLGNQCFGNCMSLERIDLPQYITELPESIFQDCSALTYVKLPAELERIGRCAFLKCEALKTLTLPAKVTSLGEKAFDECRSLENISVEDGNPVYSSVDGLLLAHSGQKLVRCPEGKTDNCVVPKTVSEIAPKAFEGCSKLAFLDLGERVQTIGMQAFAGCSSLTTVSLPSGLEFLGEKAFFQCYRLESVTFADPASNSSNPYFKTYGEQVGYNSGKFLGSIQSYTFAECRKLQSVVIPSSVKTIVDDAFYECESLKEIYCRALTPPTFYQLSNNKSSRHIVVIVMPHTGDKYRAASGWNRYVIEELISEEEYLAHRQKIIQAQLAAEEAKALKEQKKESREEKKLLRNQRRNEKAARKAMEREQRERQRNRRK